MTISHNQRQRAGGFDRLEAIVKIVASGNNLIIKNQWDGVESTYSPESEFIFFIKCGDNSLNMKFEKDNNGDWQ